MGVTMRGARLHGPGDLRIEELPVPEPGPRELLVRVEACGICPTDLRKFLIGTHDPYPLNPGHEWLGRVEAVGADVDGFAVGARVYGDTYAGYAEYATLLVDPSAWSYGALRLPDDLDERQAIFVEPLADCLHAVHDQGRVTAGEHCVVIGAGQMGVQLAACAGQAGARVTVVEPDADRREVAATFGARTLTPDEWADARAARDADCVLLSIPAADAVTDCIAACRPGARVVLFAGFGDRPQATIDLNELHYREIALVGSEWIGTPPNQRRERYEQARDLLHGGLDLARLVDFEVRLDGIPQAFTAMRERRTMKAILRP